MKQLAFWGALGTFAVIIQLAVTYWFLAPYIDDYWYRIFWAEGLMGITASGTGWLALTPYYAWPILATYGGALVVVGSVIAVAVGRSIVLWERQATSEREAAAAAQVQEAQRILAEAKKIKQVAEDEVQAARGLASRHKQEAAAQVEEAEFRLQRSVNTNIGLRRQIQELKKRLHGRGEDGTIGHC